MNTSFSAAAAQVAPRLSGNARTTDEPSATGHVGNPVLPADPPLTHTKTIENFWIS